MTIVPHIDASSPDFPGDGTDQPPFGFKDSLRSLALWPVGLTAFTASAYLIRAGAAVTDLHRIDPFLKAVARTIPRLIGIRVAVRGSEVIDRNAAYVYVVNHVNLFDMLVIYQAIPQYTRAMEHVDHFSWPVLGTLLRAVGQLPVFPDDKARTARSLKRAVALLRAGESLTVLPEGSRTLDGSLGPFFTGAFNLAIRAGVPVVPVAIRGGRAVARRGDWRFRPGAVEVLFAAPVPTAGLRLRDASRLADQCRGAIIDLLQDRRRPGT